MKLCAKLCVLCIVPSLLFGQRSSPAPKPGADGTASQPASQTPTLPRQQPETPKAMETPASSAAGQNTPSMERPASAKAPAEFGRGVVIEAVKKNSEAEKAGLQEGDILLHWARGAAQGEIESPFDLSWIEIEQAPRGPVTIEGLRGTDKKVWTLGPASWGVDARPNLPESLLPIYLEGQKLATAGKLQDAAERWQSAARKAQASQSAWLGPWFLYHAAELLANAQQWKEADAAYEELIQQSAGAGAAVKAQLLRSWSATFEQRSDWLNAGKHYQEAAEESKKLSSESLMFADALAGIGYAAVQRTDLAQAEKFLPQALEIQQRLAPGSLNVARSLNGLGLAAWHHDDLTKAEEYHSQALAIREKLAPESLAVAASLSNLGLVASDPAKEENYYLRALAIQERLSPGSLAVARTLNNLGGVAHELGDLAKEEKYYLRALAIQEKLAPGSLSFAAILSNLGSVALLRGDLLRAEECYRRALDIKEKLALGTLTVAITLENLGVLFHDRGDLAKAEEYELRALAIREKLAPGSLLVASILNNLGTVAENRGDLSKAEEYYSRALDIREKLAPGGLGTAMTMHNLGVIARDRGDMVKAEAYFGRALAIREKLASDSIYVASSLAGLGNVARDRGDLAKAEEYYRRGLAIWQRLTPEKQDYADGLATLAGIMVRKQQLDAAAPLFEQAVNVLESQMGHLGSGEEIRSGFRAKHADSYRGYIDLLIQQKQPEQAFQMLERSRAQTLLEMLGNRGVHITKAMTAAEREQEEVLLSTLVSLNRQLGVEKAARKPDEGRITDLKSDLEKARLQYSDFRTNLYAAHPKLRAQRGELQPISLSDATNLLPDNRTAILEFLVAEEKTYLFVLTRSNTGNAASPELKVYTIGVKAKDLEQEAEQFRRQLSVRDLQFSTVAARLYNLLLQPAQAQLSGVNALLIVPDGLLWNLPFQAVQVRPGHYLLEDYAVAYAPSLTVLREMVRLRLNNKDAPAMAAHQTLLAMGNPALGTATTELAKLTYRDEKLAPLPEAAREVKTLESLYGRQQSQVFVGAEATEDRFKAHAGEFEILHLATHGILNDTSPMYSHLLLSPGSAKEDGLLEAWEIMGLDLHADLAVLSACETARGRISAGEGVIGLSWAFFVAGTSTTVVSQWKVESTSTAELMLAFHRARKANEQGASPFGTARALQRAELKLLHDPRFSDPVYWAGFIVVGDPN